MSSDSSTLPPAEALPPAALALRDQGQLPRHVAIIMDGNGRWAQSRGLPRSEGHRAGAQSVRTITRACRRLGIQVLTLYAFSEQNWTRPAAEVQALLALLVDFLRSELAELQRSDIRLVAVGNLQRLPLPVRLALQHVVDATAHHQTMTLALCLSYGGREDLIHAARHLADRVAKGELQPADVDEKAVSAALWTAPLGGDPDLLIRTSGEQRLSNFLLWEAAYAELVFSPCAWPDFGTADLTDALVTYAGRQRRFGGIGPAS